MSAIPSTTKKIRRCFFISLSFVIIIPITCIVLGVTLHAKEFQYVSPESSVNRTIFLHADLISADVKQGSMVLGWSITGDSCAESCTDDSCIVNGCSNVNIYFDPNLLHSDSGNSGPADNNRPVDPIFVWNATGGYIDYLANSASFQTELAVSPPIGNYSQKHLVRHTRSSEVYYPFDRYLAEIFGFAEDASTNDTVGLHLESTSGLAVGLKISAELSQDATQDVIYVVVTLQRGTLVIWYCLVITITFWLVTLTICLIMIMTIGFGFQQRNEIVVVPVGTVFAFTQLRSSMPGAPDGFGDILDFVGVLPCLVLLSISAVTMVGIYLFTDPSKDSREKLTWSALVEALLHPRNAPVQAFGTKDASEVSYTMLPLSTSESASPGDLSLPRPTA